MGRSGPGQSMVEMTGSMFCRQVHSQASVLCTVVEARIGAKEFTRKNVSINSSGMFLLHAALWAFDACTHEMTIAGTTRTVRERGAQQMTVGGDMTVGEAVRAQRSAVATFRGRPPP